ncbi:hypothetical protein [Microvirga aerilata]
MSNDAPALPGQLSGHDEADAGAGPRDDSSLGVLGHELDLNLVL